MLIRHNTAADAWIAIDGDVYDITKFIQFHPGGAQLLAAYAGTESTEAFFDMHKTEVLYKYQRFKIGRLDSASPTRARVVDQEQPGLLSSVPYAEHNSLQGWKSPYLNDDHKKFRIAVRTWVDTNLRPNAVRMNSTDKTPDLKYFQMMGKAGILAGNLAPSKALERACSKAGISLPGGMTFDKYDLFMEAIVHEEMGRLGTPGLLDGFTGGFSIAAPTILNYATEAVRDRVMPQLLLGEKRICLAISEPFAGSDVAGIKCVAKKSADGAHYVVNGVKKWITSGQICHHALLFRSVGNDFHAKKKRLRRVHCGTDSVPHKSLIYGVIARRARLRLFRHSSPNGRQRYGWHISAVGGTNRGRHKLYVAFLVMHAVLEFRVFLGDHSCPFYITSE